MTNENKNAYHEGLSNILQNHLGKPRIITSYIEYGLWEQFEKICQNPTYKAMLIKDQAVEHKAFHVDKNKVAHTHWKIWDWLLFSSAENKEVIPFYKKIITSPTFKSDLPEIYQTLKKNIDYYDTALGEGYYPAVDLLQEKFWEALEINNLSDALNYLLEDPQRQFLFMYQFLEKIDQKFLTYKTQNLWQQFPIEKMVELHTLFLTLARPNELVNYINILSKYAGVKENITLKQLNFFKQLQEISYNKKLEQIWINHQDYKLRQEISLTLNEYVFNLNWIQCQTQWGMPLELPIRKRNTHLNNQEKSNNEFDKQKIKTNAFIQYLVEKTNEQPSHIYWTQNSHNNCGDIQKLISTQPNEREKIINSLSKNLYYLPLVLESGSPLLLEAHQKGLTKDPEFWHRLHNEKGLNIFEFLQYMTYQIDINGLTQKLAKSLLQDLCHTQSYLMFFPFNAKDERGASGMNKIRFGFEYMFAKNYFQEKTGEVDKLAINIFKKSWEKNKKIIEQDIVVYDHKSAYEELLKNILILGQQKNIYFYEQAVLSPNEIKDLLEFIATTTPHFFSHSIQHIKNSWLFDRADGEAYFDKLLLLSENFNNVPNKKIVLL